MRIKTSLINNIVANETNQMNAIPTQQLFEDLFVVQDDFANIFLIKDNNKYIAIDAGISASRIEQELAKLHIAAADVKAVLITHSDIDHVEGISAFSNAVVYLPEAEVPMLNKFRITMPETALNAAAQYYSDVKQEPGQGLFGDAEYWPADDMEIIDNSTQKLISIYKNRLNKSFKVISDGEILHFNQTSIKAVLIAGHTEGLTSYIVNDKYIFVGDGLSLRNGNVAPFNALLNLDEKQHRKSITKIQNLKGFNYLFTQHYGYTDNVAKAFKNWHE
jgi:glyoxylase-like metal-dependent hydrolase (beta-lactamase superfamily II)